MLKTQAEARLRHLQALGLDYAQLYNPKSSVRGVHAISLILGSPDEYGLPESPEVPGLRLKAAWGWAAVWMGAAVALVAWSFLAP